MSISTRDRKPTALAELPKLFSQQRFTPPAPILSHETQLHTWQYSPLASKLSGGLPAGFSGSGIFTVTPGNLQLVAHPNMAAPGTEPGIAFNSILDEPLIMNEQGSVAFLASLKNARGFDRAEEMLHEIWMADTREAADAAAGIDGEHGQPKTRNVSLWMKHFRSSVPYSPAACSLFCCEITPRTHPHGPLL